MHGRVCGLLPINTWGGACAADVSRLEDAWQREHQLFRNQIPASPTCKIGVIGDWGTGMDDSIALFDTLVAMKPDVIIHVGDIYYSGTPTECTKTSSMWCNRFIGNTT
ncbi:MAG TPA: metallophosphoesterase [Candidatus Sulfotelmatobacter sp.]